MNDPLKEKMFGYEVNPPKEVWEKIVTALADEEQKTEFSSKLYELEVPPPIDTWQQIKNSLDNESEKSIPSQRKISHLFLYAAAVVLIGVIVVGGIQLINKNSGKKEIAAKENNSPAKDSIHPLTNESAASAATNNSTEAEEKRDDAALEASKQTVAKNDFTITEKIKLSKEEYLSAPAHYIENINGSENNYPNLHYSELMQPVFINESTTDNVSDRYIMLMTPDGNFIRMSKKWADLACCVSGEDQDSGCKDQLQRWREKIACSPVAPSPGNFMDILNLINSLQDNKD